MQQIINDTANEAPKTADVVMLGQVKTMNSSFSGLFFGLAAAIVLIYLLIVVNFQSWADPFVIITALPAALAVEAVIDKDLASELLAEDVAADLFVMATDVNGVYVGWATPQQRRLNRNPGGTGQLPVRGRVHGHQGRGRACASPPRPVRERRSAHWPTSPASWPARAPSVVPQRAPDGPA